MPTDRDKRASARAPDDDAERFALAALGDEGLVLDVATGEIYRVDAAGVVAFGAIGRGLGVAGAAAALARAFETEPGRAARDVQRMLRSLSCAPRRAPAPASVRFEPREGGGYDLFIAGRRAAWIDASGRVVERVGAAGRASAALRIAAPHVLALRGRAVLHASAVVSRRGAVAFVGPSGVGKSTLARRLSRHMRVVSEDLLVLASVREAVLDGEGAIRSWSTARSRAVRTDGLLACADGARCPLRAVLLVERAAGRAELELEPLRGVDAVAALFANAFAELPSPRVWRRALATSRALAARGIVHRLLVPEGLGALGRALRRSSGFDDPVEALFGRAR